MKHMRRIWTLSLLLVALACALATTALADSTTWGGSTDIATEFATGKGTESEPYQISTGAELAYLAQEVNKGTTGYVSAYYILTADIVLNEGDSTTNQWTPIGDNSTSSSASRFTGTFDGDGKTVSGLYIDETANQEYYAGLFGYVDGGTVKNVNVSGSVSANTETYNYTSYIIYVGGVVGINYGGTVESCSSAVTVSGSAENKHAYVGGVVGKSSNGTNSGIVRNCYATGAVTGTVTSSTTHSAYAGGVVGHNMGFVYNCYATGAVTATSTNNAYAGGVVGYHSSSTKHIYNCYATGAVSATGGTGKTVGVGGVVGYNGGTVSDCYWSSDVEQKVNNASVQTKVGIGSGTTTGDTVTNVVSFTDTGTMDSGKLSDGETSYTDLLTALNAWVNNKKSTDYRLWESKSDTTPELGDYWMDLDYAVTTTDGAYKETEDTEDFTGTLNITAAGTYTISMAEGKTSSDKGIVIYDSAGDVTLIFDDVTIETYGGTISTQSGYTGTLTIQGELNVTSSNGNAIDVKGGNLAISGTGTEITASSGNSCAIYAAGTLTISGASTQVTASSDTGKAISASTEPTLTDVYAKSSQDKGVTYQTGLAWDTTDKCFTVDGTPSTYIIIDSEPAPEETATTYTVTFGTEVVFKDALEGQILVLPSYEPGIHGAALTAGQVFTGWTYNGTTYKAGASFTQPAKNVVFTAVIEDVTTVAPHSITVIVKEETSGTLSGADVALKQGNIVYAEGKTDANGEYKFTNILSGTYNIVVVYDGKTVTKSIVLTDTDVTQDVEIPTENQNSIVEVKDQTPAVVVGQLDEVASSEFDDETSGDSGVSSVTVTLTVEKQTETKATGADEIINTATTDSILEYLDISIIKDVDGTTSNITDTAGNVLELVVPYHFDGKDTVTVYRHHVGETDIKIFTALTSKPDSNFTDGTFYSDKDNNLLYIYGNQFSTYAIGYTEVVASSGGTSTFYSSVSQPENGTIDLDSGRYRMNSTVTFTVTPDEGYEVDSVTVTYSSGKTVTVTDLGDGKYSYTQPGATVTVNVTFVAIDDDADNEESTDTGDSADTEDSTDNREGLPYIDVDKSDWHYDYVADLYYKSVMTGVTEITFEPEWSTDRATFLVVLYRMSGGVPVDYLMPFEDVAEDAWYAEAVRWGASTGVTQGTSDTTFSPDEALTREQLVTLLWRYSQLMGVDVSVGEDTNILSYEDVFEISDYAISAMQWSCGAGIIEGRTESTLNPLEDITRAELATVISRYLTE